MPTDVVVEEASCSAGELTVTVRPGVAVARRGRATRGGKVPIAFSSGALAGGCELSTTALGFRIARDLEVTAGTGATVSVEAGALVRRLPARRAAAVTVESVGATRAVFPVPADALTIADVEFVFHPPPVRRFVTPFQDTPLYAHAASVGTNAPAVAVAEGGREVVLLEQRGTLARVRTYGPVEVEGWALNKHFADRGQEAEAQLLKPTHEVLTWTPLFASAAAPTPALVLRGGALLEAGRAEGGRIKITTTGELVVSGWVDHAALRPLAAP